MEKIKVFIKTNENDEITKIASSIFLKDTTDWIEIDEGDGDKYAHAQGNYFDKPLKTRLGSYNYKYVNGEIIEVDNEAADQEKEEIQQRIVYIRGRLNELSQDFIQSSLGAVFEDLDERKSEFVSLHNELRVLLGKDERVYMEVEQGE